MKNIKGLFVCNTFFPDSAGVGNATRHLCRALDEFTNIQPHVIVPNRTNSPQREYHSGTHIFRVPLGRWARNNLLSFIFYPIFGIFFVYEVIRLKPAFVLFQTAWEAGCLIPFTRLINPGLIMVHTHADVHYSSRFKSWARFAYRNAHMVLATTSQYVRELSSNYGCSNVKIVPNTYYQNDFADDMKGSDGLIHDTNGYYHIVSVGRMVNEKDSETKGVSYLLKAAEQTPRIFLHIFGDGPNRKVYQRMASNLGLDQRCRFYGHRPSKELQGYMEASDALVMSSLHEGLSMTLLEAMSMGVPVISTNTAGVRDYISDRENGLIMEAGDVSSMVSVLKYAEENRELMKSIGKNGKNTFKKRLSPKVISENFVTLLEQATDSLPGLGKEIRKVHESTHLQTQ